MCSEYQLAVCVVVPLSTRAMDTSPWNELLKALGLRSRIAFFAALISFAHCMLL